MLGLAQRYLSLLGRKRPSPQIATKQKNKQTKKLVDNDVDRGNAVNSDCDKESLYIYICVCVCICIYIYMHTNSASFRVAHQRRR